MKSRILSIGTFVLLVLLAPVWATDITGTWIATMPIPYGTVETAFHFKVEGKKVTGTVRDYQGETVISEGKIEGDEISFVVIRSLSGHNLQETYKGKIGIDEIKFTCGVGEGMGQPKKFIAKREFQRNGDVPVLPSIKLVR